MLKMHALAAAAIFLIAFTSGASAACSSGACCQAYGGRNKCNADPGCFWSTGGLQCLYNGADNPCVDYTGCKNTGVCVASGPDPTCVCNSVADGFGASQWSGADCNTCLCQNSGTCTGSGGSCVCPGGYIGDRCQTCGCQNGGTCSGANGACVCPEGFSGDYCQQTVCTQADKVGQKTCSDFGLNGKCQGEQCYGLLCGGSSTYKCFVCGQPSLPGAICP